MFSRDIFSFFFKFRFKQFSALENSYKNAFLCKPRHAFAEYIDACFQNMSVDNWFFFLEAAQYLDKTPKLEMKRPINYYSYSKGIYEMS